MSLNEQAILKTLIYADIFDYSLTPSEVFERLISRRPTNKSIIDQNLKQMVESNLISVSGINYFLPGKNHLPLVKRNRLKFSTKKYLIAKKIAQKLSKIYLIEAVFVTGTVATNNANDDDDIDIMIISAPGKLWTTRLITTIYLDILGIRRKPGQTEVNNSICANLYLDASNLTVSQKQQNLYTAHEVILAKPVFDRHNLADKFLKSNQWVKKFLPNTLISKSRQPKNITAPKSNWIEKTCYSVQKTYMSSKITREVITETSAYFHPIDTSTIILDKYNRSLKHYEII